MGVRPPMGIRVGRLRTPRTRWIIIGRLSQSDLFAHEFRTARPPRPVYCHQGNDPAGEETPRSDAGTCLGVQRKKPAIKKAAAARRTAPRKTAAQKTAV